MSHHFLIHPKRLAVTAALLVAMAALAQAQNTTIGVGSPGPVVPRNGMLGTYYDYPSGSPTPPGNPPGSPDTTPAVQAGAAQFLQRLDPSLTINFQGNAPPGSANGSDWFMVVWEGRIVIPTTGAYTFYVLSDDGERSWFGSPFGATPNLEFWVQRGVPGTPDTFPMPGTTNAGTIDARFEMEQGNGGVSMQVQWSGPPSATRVDIPSVNLLPPAGPNAVTPTVTPVANNPTPAINISWPDSLTPVPATSWILSRATAVGGPFTQIAVQTTRTFADTPPAFGTYFYIVQGTAANAIIVGDPAAPVSGTSSQPPISVSPAGPIVTSEAGLNATLTLTVNVVPTSDVTVTITSSDATEANLSAPGVPQGNPIIVTIPNGSAVGTTVAVTVHGLDDPAADGPIGYNITFGIAGGGYTGAAINPVAGTNNDNDTPGITVTPINQPTTEGGGTAQFSITFNTAPNATTTITVTSGNPAEAVVTSVVPPDFTAANYSTSHVVTLTGVDDTVLDFGQPFTITVAATAGDPAYTAIPPIAVGGLNLDDEQTPTLPHVWGGSGKGGCGLTGLEVVLLLGLGAAWRRRRNS